MGSHNCPSTRRKEPYKLAFHRFARVTAFNMLACGWQTIRVGRFQQEDHLHGGIHLHRSSFITPIFRLDAFWKGPEDPSHSHSRWEVTHLDILAQNQSPTNHSTLWPCFHRVWPFSFNKFNICEAFSPPVFVTTNTISCYANLILSPALLATGLQQPGFDLLVQTVASGHCKDEKWVSA